MAIVIASTVALLFIFLAFLHFYWAFFGIKNPEQVLPTKLPEAKPESPGSLITALVGIGLFLFALVFANQVLGLLNYGWLKYAQMAIALIFLVRAVGDFKYVGFFKTIRHTPFALMDTKYYSPLCLVLALLISLSIVTA